MKAHNAGACLTRLVNLLNLPVTASSIYDELEKHPNYPSLLAFSDVLNNWGIPNGAYRVSSSELDTIPVPFLAHLSVNGGEFILVEHIADDFVTIFNERNNVHKLDKEKFNSLYSGSLLIAEFAPNAGELNYTQKRRKELVEKLRIPFVVFGCLTLMTILLYQSSYFNYFSWSKAVLLFTKSIGLIVSSLLLIQSIDSTNPLIQRLCASGKNFNCNAILASKASKVTEEISWSEIGFFYFAGTHLVLITNGSSIPILRMLAIINLLCLPYTLYSIYYQTYIAKQWCLLCCTIQVFLWLEFFAFFPYLFDTTLLPNRSEWIALGACLFIPIICWIYIKPYLLQAQQLTTFKQRLRTFKHNTDVFAKTLSEQPRYNLLSKNDSIILGNPVATQVITVVSNPYCKPCSHVHKLLENWLRWKEDIQVQVIFVTDDDVQTPRTQVASHLMALNQQNPALARQAVHSWYVQEKIDFSAWTKFYPIAEGLVEQSSLQRQRDWCRMAAVTSTPTILLNGHKLPDLYQLNDIQYFL